MNKLISDFYLFVIEDYHLIEKCASAKNIINHLIEKTPDNCHLVITSRNPLHLPAISNLKMQQQVIEIRADQFLFSATEVKELFSSQFKIALGDSDAEKIVSETEGWVPAVLLRGFNFNSAVKSNPSKLNQDDLFEYLAANVFEVQSPNVQDFLLNTAIIDDLDPGFCDSLLGLHTSKTVLDDLCAKNLFTTLLESEKPLYRYHKLLRDFLLERLSLKSPEHFLILHYKAGLLFEKEQQWSQSIHHFLQARKYSDAIRVVKKVGDEYIRAGKWSTVFQWVDLLPRESVSTDPELAVLKAEAIIHLGNPNEAALILTQVQDNKSCENDWMLVATALSWRGAAYRTMSRFAEAKRDIKKALTLFTLHNGPENLMGDAFRRLGDIYTEQGQLRGALRYQKAALNHYDSTYDLALISHVHNSLGITYKRLGQLARASFHFEQARQGWQKLKNFGALSMTLNNVGIVYQRQGQYDLALETLNVGLERSHEAGYLRTEACILISKGEVLRDMGRYQEALDSFQHGLEIAREVIEPYFVTYAIAGMGEIYRLLGVFDKAEVLLKDALMQSESRKQEYESILVKMQLALVESDSGRFGSAIELLNNCCVYLIEAGDKDALARAYFHLAHVSFLSKRYESIGQYIENIEGLVDELGYDDFLVVEGRNAILFLQYCVTRKIGRKLLTKILYKIREQSIDNESQRRPPVFTRSGVEIHPLLQVTSFGSIQVQVNGRRVEEDEWRSKRSKELFIYLLLCREPRTREHLSTALWPDLSPSRGTSNFHINLYRARRATLPVVFTYVEGKYAINPEINIDFDVNEFRRLLQKAFDKRTDNKLVYLEKALKLYKAPFAQDMYSDWIETYRRRLEDEYINALFSAVRCYGEQKRFQQSILLMAKAITSDPYNDEAYFKMMECQLANEDKTSAYRTYHRYLDIVVSETKSIYPPIQKLYYNMVTN